MDSTRFPNCKQLDDPFQGCGICKDGYDHVNDGMCCKSGEEFARVDTNDKDIYKPTDPEQAPVGNVTYAERISAHVRNPLKFSCENIATTFGSVDGLKPYLNCAKFNRAYEFNASTNVYNFRCLEAKPGYILENINPARVALADNTAVHAYPSSGDVQIMNLVAKNYSFMNSILKS